ncbi:MAG TPA: BON domain-containing protein [Terriglobia bacterium]|nr:BON domain-containing protein [Terriglobia bacterium]
MRRFLVVPLFVAVMATSLSSFARAQKRPIPVRAEQRISDQVRHEILMLPYYNVFDDISYKVQGYNVTLMGAVTQPILKSEAGNVVKRIEGVERVDNQIEVLPTSNMDVELRLRLFRAIYGYPALQRYALSVQKPIRIIVKNGHVTLEGVVDNQADKNMVNIRSKSVPGIFSVTDDLRVVKP